METSEDLRPALAVVAVAVAGMLAANVVLIRHGKAPITHVFRTRPGRLFLDYFDWHCDGLLGPLDAFSHAARLIPPRRLVP